MTKQETTNKRSLAFSSWIRRELPDSKTGFCVGNQDWIFYDWKRKILLLAEEKTHMAEISVWFHHLIKDIIHPALKEFCPKHGIDYRGYHLIQFENNCADDGKIWLDRKEVTQAQLKDFLSLK